MTRRKQAIDTLLTAVESGNIYAVREAIKSSLVDIVGDQNDNPSLGDRLESVRSGLKKLENHSRYIGDDINGILLTLAICYILEPGYSESEEVQP